MGRRITQDEFIQKCIEINPDLDYSNTVYLGSTTKVSINCPKHGSFEINPSAFLRKGKCPKCSLKIPTNQEFIEKCQLIFPNYNFDNIIYTGRHSKVKVKCNIHNYEFEIAAGDLLNGHGCPKCKSDNAKKQAYTNEQFITQAKLIHDNKYDYSKVEYINSKTKVCIICPEHGEFWQIPANHLRGTGCPKCSGGIIYTKEDFITKAIQIHGTKYDYSKVEYKNSIEPVIIICKKHGEFLQKPVKHLQGCGCPTCNSSKGEQLIKSWLELNQINYIEQYRIKIDKNINSSEKAFIDFYLPDYNTFIEYNGIQHYVAKDYFGGEIQLKHQQSRDEYVRNFCSEYSIKLIEIKYDQNVEEVLNDKINIYGR